MAKKQNPNEEVLINITGTVVLDDDAGNQVSVTEKQNPIGVPRRIADDLIRRGKAELHTVEVDDGKAETGNEG